MNVRQAAVVALVVVALGVVPTVPAGGRAIAQSTTLQLAPDATGTLARPGGTATIVNQSEVGVRADAVGPLIVAPPRGFDIRIVEVDGPGAAACRRMASQPSITIVCEEAPAGDLRLVVTAPAERMPLEVGCTEMPLPGFGGDLIDLATYVRPAAALESLWSRQFLRAFLVGGGESYQFVWRGYVPEGSVSHAWTVPTDSGQNVPSTLFICLKEAGVLIRPAGR